MNSLHFYRYLVLINGAVPLIVLVWDAFQGQLGANSVNYALHVTGILSLLFLILSLCMSPLRWLSGWSGWIAFRRSLGLFAFCYSILHLAIYVGLDREFNMESTLNEIWMRRFLQVGTAGVFLMLPLALTSTNSMIRRVGARNWKSLHRLAYVVAVLGVVHYYMLVKSDVRQPIAFGIVLGGLLVGRLGHRYFGLTKSATGDRDKPDKAMSKYWSGELKVVTQIQETHDVRTFRLGSVDGSPLPFEYQPGQYMNLQLMINGTRVNRSYTIASSPTRKDTCELTVKRDPNGTASLFLHDQIQIGETLSVSAPAGKFVFLGTESKAVLLIAGGVGITPLMSIARYLTDRSWTGYIYFLIVTKTEKDIIFRDEIESLKQHNSNLRVCITLTEADMQHAWSGERGRASAALLSKFVPELPNIPTYLCGPEAMMAATRDLLIGLGTPATMIKTEAFVSPGVARKSQAFDWSNATSNEATMVVGVSDQVDSLADVDNEKYTLRFARSGKTMEVSSKSTILELAEELGVEVAFECRSGVCGQCMTKLLKGHVKMDSEVALSDHDKSNGYILACQAHPHSDITVEA